MPRRPLSEGGSKIKTFRIDAETDKKLEELSQITGQNESEIIRDALRFYMESKIRNDKISVYLKETSQE